VINLPFFKITHLRTQIPYETSKSAMKFTTTELTNIVEWKPYRPEWPIRLQEKEDGIEAHFGALIHAFTEHTDFDVAITQDGSMSNFLEIVCFIPQQTGGNSPALIVCISFCAPIAAFAEIEAYISEETLGWDTLDYNTIGKVKSPILEPIKNAVVAILEQHQLPLLDPDYAAELLSPELLDKVNAPHDENRIIHGIFQWED
jgi:hypothetical protein